MGGAAVGPALVRLRAGQRVLGAGFLVAPDVVATCAHVVDTGLVVDFPLLGSRGHAVEELERDDGLDVAILRLAEPPPGALPAPARISGEVRDHRFRTFGFPHDMPDGVWVTGRLLGAEGSGRVQMAVDPDHWHVEPGFSGAPVWDEELAGVVGMVVTVSARSGTTAHLVPTSALGAAWTTPARNPYRGLRPFREEDAELFHGRDADAERLFDLVRRQDVVAVAGPSGSGKSSLVRAGLIPKLREHGSPVVHLGASDAVPESPAPGTVLVLDQFEETAAADPAAAREKLAAVIRLAGTARAVLTLRSRSLDELITKDTVEELNRAVWFLEPMSREQLAAAVEGPAAVVGGLAFESGLVQRILDDAEPGTLPLLSLVLDQLWQNRHGGWLTHEAYERLGRVPGAISTAADGVLAALDVQQRRAARQLLTQLTRPDGERGHARRSADLDDLTPDLRAIAQELAARRLLTIQDDRVDLAHQALIDHWPTLRDWLDRDVDFLTWRAKLHDLRASGGHLTGAALAEALDWLGSRPTDIDPAHRDFIQAAEAHRRRDQRRWRTTTAVSVALALVALLLTGVVARYAVQTRDQLRTTNAALLAQASQRANAVDPRQGLQLAMAAYAERSDSPEAFGALLQQRVNWDGTERIIPPDLLPTGDIWSMTASADGRVLITYPGDWSKAPSVWWDIDGPHPRHRVLPVDPGSSPPAAVTLSPNGRFLAVLDMPSRDLRVLDLADQDRAVELTPPPVQVGQVSFSANSRFISATPVEQGQPVRVWDLHSGAELPSRANFAHLPGETAREAFPAPDGRSLITWEASSLDLDSAQQVVVRDLATGAPTSTYPSDFDDLLVGNGTLLVTCDDSGLRAVEPLTGRTTGALPNPLGCSHLSTDLTGQYLVPSSGGNTLPAPLVHWPTWQQQFVGFDLSDTVVLRPRGDHDLTVITRHNGALSVRIEATTEEGLGHYSRFTRGPGGTLWAAVDTSQEAIGLQLVLLDEQGSPLASTPVPGTSGTDLTYTPIRLSFDGSGERIALSLGPVVRTFRAAGLVLERELQLPQPPEHGFSANTRVSLLPSADGGLVVGALGMLSFWDLGTGAQTAPPLVVERPRAGGLKPGTPRISARPGHPEQLLVLADGNLTVRDVRARTVLHSFPVRESGTSSDFVVSADGRYVAFDITSPPVSVVDLDTATVVSSINTSDVFGITDRYLITFSNDGLGVWDWPRRREVAAVTDVGASHGSAGFWDDQFLLDARPGLRPPIPMAPDRWFADLCRLADRPYTPQEEALLPAGTSTEPPCEAGGVA